MRTAIDGTHSVGKTTLHEALKNVLINWNFISETVRQVAPNFDLKTHDDWARIISDRQRYISFIQVLIDTQFSLESNRSFIVDGSIYRIIAHAKVSGIDVFDRYLDHVKYDLIMYCPIEFDFVKDGFRFSDNRNEVDSMLRYMIKRHHQGKVADLKGSIEDRVHMSIEIFNGLEVPN
jgi:nicotinamide riboside kinase